jgi:hypothetical protein
VKLRLTVRKIYFHVCVGVSNYRRGPECWMDLLTTCIHHSKLHFTDHWHIQASVLSLLQSPPAVSWQRLLPREILSSPHSHPLATAARAEYSSTDNTTNWFPGWRPSHTNLLIFSSHADFQLIWIATELSHQPATSRHFTQLNCWQIQMQLGWCPRYITSERTQQKTRSPAILLLLSWRLPSDRLDIVSAITCLRTVT